MKSLKLLTLLEFGMVMILLSCTFKKENRYKTEILGEWEADDIKNLSFHNNHVGYEFMADNVCNNKTGYFRSKPNKPLEYAGTLTKYEIRDDSLKIFDPGDSLWKSMLILNLSGDTLKVKNYNNTVTKYVRKHPLKNDHPLLFDQIVITTSGCYGTCPVNGTSITKNGDIVYFGKKYNEFNGFYTATTRPEMFRGLQLAFAKANIAKLETDYSAGWTDDETITVTFISKGKIVKTISDYGRGAPSAFNWAYIPLKYLHQQLKLTRVTDLPEEFMNFWLLIKNGKQSIHLKESETFYLWTMLMHARRTTQPFNKKYDLLFEYYGTPEPSAIETDGQRFKFSGKNKARTEFDLGFNFISKNAEVFMLRDKPDYY